MIRVGSSRRQSIDTGVRPFPLSVFSLVRETWSTQSAVIQSSEAYRLEYFSDYHLDQISLKQEGGREHVLHCDGSFKGLAMPRV